MNKNSNFNFKYKIINKIILYLLLSISFFFFTYLSIPKFLNYTPELIEESLRKNSGFNIKNISSINYRIFPSPRLRVYGSNLELEENVLKVQGSEIDIILDPLNLIHNQKLHYNTLLVKGGSTNIKINKINHLLNQIKKNKKKITFKKNNIIILRESKKLFEINNSIIRINSENNVQQLKINGLLLNYKIYFLFKNNPESKSNITLKVPDLDVSTNISFENKNNFKSFEGLVNFEILNNFFQFNFIKTKNITINNGFIRNNLINSSFEGEVNLKPYFSFDLDLKPTKANIKELFSIIQKNYFSEDSQNLEIIKKMNGSLNFKTMFKGNLIFKNREILFQNFKTGKEDPIFFDAKISEFGEKGKIKFNLLKNIQYKENLTKELKIAGFINPYSSKVIFEQVLIDKKIFNKKKIKNYEKKFKNEVINISLNGIFNEKKMNNFFKNFSN